MIDSRLSLSDHVAAVYRSGYYQLRQLRPVVTPVLVGRRHEDDGTTTDGCQSPRPNDEPSPKPVYWMTRLARRPWHIEQLCNVTLT